MNVMYFNIQNVHKSGTTIHCHQTIQESHDHTTTNYHPILNLWPQHALTEGVLGGEIELRPPLLAHSCPFLEARAAKNLLFHRPLAETEAEVEFDTEAEATLPQAWSAGKRCLRHTFMWQVLHVLVLENVRTSLQRLTGQIGFFFLLGSQVPDLWCLSKMASSSCPTWPVVSMDMEHVSHTITFLLLWSDLGQEWDL